MKQLQPIGFMSGLQLARRVALAGLVSAVVACGGGGGGETSVAPEPAPGPAPGPTPASTVTITVALQAPATVKPGTVWVRIGSAAATRAAITPQDLSCSTSNSGNTTCSYRVTTGQTVTLVATDSGAEVGFVWQPIVSLRDADPRGTRSQFIEFDGPCATPERGVCVITASADQTITVRNAPLKLTRMRFIGLVNWNVSISASPTLNVGSNMSTGFQSVNASPNTPGVGECITDPVIAITCYQIYSANNSVIKFEALPPPGPQPQGSSGPLLFVGYDNACGSSGGCTVTSEVDETITMKWQYYKCSNQSMNTRWNFGPTQVGSLGEVCPLTTP